MSLKKWYELTIELKFIDINQNLSLVDAIGGNVSLKLDDGKLKESYVSFVLIFFWHLLFKILIQCVLINVCYITIGFIACKEVCTTHHLQR